MEVWMKGNILFLKSTLHNCSRQWEWLLIGYIQIESCYQLLWLQIWNAMMGQRVPSIPHPAEETMTGFLWSSSPVFRVFNGWVLDFHEMDHIKCFCCLSDYSKAYKHRETITSLKWMKISGRSCQAEAQILKPASDLRGPEMPYSSQPG